jgi:phospholysine phosphohistidine inorganic pyrophosphate phosphatase
VPLYYRLGTADNESVNLRGILLDMDGVLYNDQAAIPGAAEAVRWLASRDIPLLFVTNTSSRGRYALALKLRGFSIEADIAHIHTPCVAARTWLATHADGPVALFMRDAARGEFQGLPQVVNEAPEECGAVVIGDLGDAWDYDTLNRAFRLLYYHPNAKLIALGMTRYWRTSSGLCLDVGPYVAALEYATGRTPMVFGKPAPAFFQAAAEQLELTPKEVLMVGDDVRVDVGGAQAAGLRGALVRTGKFCEADLAGEVKPDAVIGSIADLPEWWERNAGSGAFSVSRTP